MFATRRPTARLTALAPLPIVAIACSTGDTASTWAGTVTDSAGVQVVHNPLEGIWGPRDAWALEEVLSIGELLGEPEYQFGQIISVDTDDAGNVYIADFQAQEARVFDSEGLYTHTIGGAGAGPGEIGMGLSGVFALPDEVFVPDIGNGRINRCAHDGELLGDDTHAGAVGELVHLTLVSPLLDGQRDQRGENDHQRLERELRQPGQ